MAKDYAWAIYLIRAKGELVGWVYAPDEKTAIARAIEKFEIANVEQQKRLIAPSSLSQSAICCIAAANGPRVAYLKPSDENMPIEWVQNKGTSCSLARTRW